MTDGWLHLEHEETGGTTSIPDDPAVLAAQEARGWRRVDPPEPGPFVPVKVNADPGADPEWVTLVHPDIKAQHDFPNNPDALAGAADAGWVAPDKAAAAATTEPAGDTAGPETSEQAESAATDPKE